MLCVWDKGVCCVCVWVWGVGVLCEGGVWVGVMKSVIYIAVE